MLNLNSYRNPKHVTGLIKDRPMLICAMPIRELKPINLQNGCEAVELRLDYMGNRLEYALTALSDFIRDLLSKVNVIVTVREPSEGGVNVIDPRLKVKALNVAVESGALIDVEVDFLKTHRELVNVANRAVLSRHILTKVSDVKSLISDDYALANEVNALTYKVASINDSDLPALINLLINEGKTPVAIIPMSPRHRAVAIMLGTALMYCAADGGTAPGQLSIQACRRIKELARSI